MFTAYPFLQSYLLSNFKEGVNCFHLGHTLTYNPDTVKEMALIELKALNSFTNTM